MVTVTQFAHYAGHIPEQCEACGEFPEDLSFQGAVGGRAHFEEWLRRRGEDQKHAQSGALPHAGNP